MPDQIIGKVRGVAIQNGPCPSGEDAVSILPTERPLRNDEERRPPTLLAEEGKDILRVSIASQRQDHRGGAASAALVKSSGQVSRVRHGEIVSEQIGHHLGADTGRSAKQDRQFHDNIRYSWGDGNRGRTDSSFLRMMNRSPPNERGVVTHSPCRTKPHCKDQVVSDEKA